MGTYKQNKPQKKKNKQTKMHYRKVRKRKQFGFVRERLGLYMYNPYAVHRLETKHTSKILLNIMYTLLLWFAKTNWPFISLYNVVKVVTQSYLIVRQGQILISGDTTQTPIYIKLCTSFFFHWNTASPTLKLQQYPLLYTNLAKQLFKSIQKIGYKIGPITFNVTFWTQFASRSRVQKISPLVIQGLLFFIGKLRVRLDILINLTCS